MRLQNTKSKLVSLTWVLQEEGILGIFFLNNNKYLKILLVVTFQNNAEN